MIKLVVGLGNPGSEYQHTRHNVGFWWVDAAAQALRTRLVAERAYFGLAARALHDGATVWLLQPQTFMNLSGKSVAALARFFKITPQEILVVHDELDLPPGQMRLKLGGGHAGHNGLRDIVAQLGSADFWRLRLGIGHPGTREEVADYVLRKPVPAERDLIERAVGESIATLELLLGARMEQAMMKLHVRPPRPARPLRQDPPGTASTPLQPGIAPPAAEGCAQDPTQGLSRDLAQRTRNTKEST